MTFDLNGFWLVIPDCQETFLAKDLLKTLMRDQVIPLWLEHSEHWVLVPPRPPAPPSYHYQLTNDKKYLYRYVGEWKWKY